MSSVWPENVYLMLSRNDVSIVWMALERLAATPSTTGILNERERDEVIRGLQGKIRMFAFGDVKGE